MEMIFLAVALALFLPKDQAIAESEKAIVAEARIEAEKNCGKDAYDIIAKPLPTLEGKPQYWICKIKVSPVTQK